MARKTFIQEVKEMSLKSFEEKNKDKIEFFKEEIRKQAESGAFRFKVDAYSMQRYLANRYGFKISGVFLEL